MRWLAGLAGVLVAAPAFAAWPPPIGNPGQTTPETTPYDRKADSAEGSFWRKKYEPSKPGPLPPAVNFPGLPPLPGMHPPGRTKTGPMTLDDLHMIKDGKGGYRGRRPGYKFSIDGDGSIKFDDRPSFEPTPVLLLGMVGLVATFDLTDLVMRLHGDDPYVYDKARVIDLTREMRSKMTDGDRTRRLDEAITALPRQLTALWARSDLSPAAKRALLFGLWDELLEAPVAGASGSAAAEAETRLRAATDARASIVGFVRTRLPAGSAQAFTPAELTQLNTRRRSRAVFAPYQPAAPATPR